MEAFQTMMVLYITVSTACVVGCIVATMLVYLDYMRQKRARTAEVEHLKEEVRVCRELLKRRGVNGEK